MYIAQTAKDPVVLSYLALRKAVGWIAVGLPFALVIPWWIFRSHLLPTSISGYYYTGMRNLFEGSLCAIAMFNLCCRGYDWKDEIAGILSAFFALGVAFFPTRRDGIVPTLHQQLVGNAHLVFASLLFLTLAYFCLFLFRMTATNVRLTRKKLQRNQVYTVCGWLIVASLASILLFKVAKRPYLFGRLGAMFCFETIALFAFGFAWLVKGETILKDDVTETASRKPPSPKSSDGQGGAC
jgi:hypothetical protein